jgi:hypothetical protein
MVLRRFVWGIVVPLVGACSLVTSLDGTTGGEMQSSAIEAGTGDGANGDGPFELSPDESDADGEAGPCVRRPTVIVDGTPEESAGFSCDVANASERDGKFAGLDSNSGSFGTIGSESVSSCFEARFDGDIGARVVVHAMAGERAWRRLQRRL